MNSTLIEFMKSKEAGAPTPELINLWKRMIAHHLKEIDYKNLSVELREDLSSGALEYLLRSWGKFNPERSDNPSSYYYVISHSAIISQLAHERRINMSLPVRDESLRTKLGVTTLDKDEVIKSLLRRMREGQNPEFLLGIIRWSRSKGFSFPEFKVIEKSLEHEIRNAS